jgi:hypothetical protein
MWKMSASAGCIEDRGRPEGPSAEILALPTAAANQPSGPLDGTAENAGRRGEGERRDNDYLYLTR